ncbi:MAG: radical SAM protein [Lachnospiraceae bacterium]|nr:radical SAM protein [Lachnospiraceae bacterium]
MELCKSFLETLNRESKECNVPLYASIEIITKCNFNCIHCYIPEHKDYMSFDKITKCIDELKIMGTLELMLTGGEIFLHKDILKIIKYARMQGFRVVLFTNCSLITEEIAKELADLYVTEISTTIFSMEANVNDKITQRVGALEMIKRAIDLLKMYGIKTEIKVPIMNVNKFDYRKICDFCLNEGCKFNYTTAITSKLDGNKSPCRLQLDYEDLRMVITDLNMDNTEKSETRMSQETDSPVCDALLNSVHIDVNGNVFPCISFPYKFGNVFATPFSEIWHSSKRSELLSIKKSELKTCIGCEYKSTCNRCPGLALSEDNTLYGCSTLDKRLAMALASL